MPRSTSIPSTLLQLCVPSPTEIAFIPTSSQHSKHFHEDFSRPFSQTSSPKQQAPAPVFRSRSTSFSPCALPFRGARKLHGRVPHARFPSVGLLLFVCFLLSYCYRSTLAFSGCHSPLQNSAAISHTPPRIKFECPSPCEIFPASIAFEITSVVLIGKGLYSSCLLLKLFRRGAKF